MKYTLVCGVCLSDIMISDIPFNVFDCSWRCPNCKRLWFSSDCCIVINRLAQQELWIFTRWNVAVGEWKALGEDGWIFTY